MTERNYSGNPAQTPASGYSKRGGGGEPWKVRVRARKRFLPCWWRVAREERMVQQVSRPPAVRQPPATLCLPVGIRPACSPRLWVKGTPGAVMKRQTSSA